MLISKKLTARISPIVARIKRYNKSKEININYVDGKKSVTVNSKK